MTGDTEAAWWFWAPYLCGFAIVGFWETFAPLRPSPVSTPRRWAVNATLLALANAVQTVVLRAAPGAVALASSSSSVALLPRTELPIAAQWVISILALDLVRYLQHVATHKASLLWRLHQVHHADPHYDLTTGLRFHPIEAIFTNGLYLGFVSVLGPPVGAALAVEAAAGFQSIFAHANAGLPSGIDRVLRHFWITPNLHRIHHSANPSEQNSNFGMLFPIWDRVFGTYRDAALLPQATMPIGVEGLPARTTSNVLALLTLPFRRG